MATAIPIEAAKVTADLAIRNTGTAAGTSAVAGTSVAVKVGLAAVIGIAVTGLVVGLPMGITGFNNANKGTTTTTATTTTFVNVTVVPDWAKFPHEEGVHTWSYDTEAHDGPDHWGTVKNATTGALLYPTCADKSTSKQSPIDIISSSTVATVPANQSLHRFYEAESFRIAPRPGGHPGFNVIPNSGTANWTIDEKLYTLLQFHYHSPSEHTIDGKQFPLEVHFVHQAADGSLAVFGILFPYSSHGEHIEEGIEPNEFLSKWWGFVFSEVRLVPAPGVYFCAVYFCLFCTNQQLTPPCPPPPPPLFLTECHDYSHQYSFF